MDDIIEILSKMKEITDEQKKLEVNSEKNYIYHLNILLAN